MQILSLSEIKKRLFLPAAIELQEAGFKIFSKGEVDIPLPGYLAQDNPVGSYHIKYGHIHGDPFWVVKIAGGPDNLPMNGTMIVFSTVTGAPLYLLQENGYLTQLRTAIAGLIAAKTLANKEIIGIGIIGTGEQARLQLRLLAKWTACKDVHVWGRSIEKTLKYKQEMEEEAFRVFISKSATEVAQKANLIVTTTSSTVPLLNASAIQPGTHITAVGADDATKMELDPHLVASADLVVVDSKVQCIDHGEVREACRQNLLSPTHLVELGQILSNPLLGRKSTQQITIADLTGIAVQDMQIAKAVFQR